MANVGQAREELVGSQRENQFLNLERRRDRQHTPSVMVESYHTELLSGVTQGLGVMFYMFKRHGSCNRK